MASLFAHDYFNCGINNKNVNWPHGLIFFLVYQLGSYSLNFFETSQLLTVCGALCFIYHELRMENWGLVRAGTFLPHRCWQSSSSKTRSDLWVLLFLLLHQAECSVHSFHSFLRLSFTFTGYEENILLIYEVVFNNGREYNSIIITDITVWWALPGGGTLKHDCPVLLRTQQ